MASTIPAPVPDVDDGAPAPAGSPQPAVPRRLSPSALDAYRECPRKFYFGWVLRLDRNQRPSPVLVQANAVHAALERFMGLRPDARTAENLERALRSVWAGHRQPGAFADAAEEAQYGREAIELLERFRQGHRLSSVRVVARERWASFRAANGMELFGKIDRLDRSCDDPPALAIVDYKVGRPPADLEDLTLLELTSAADVYALAAEAESGQLVDRVRLLYLKGDAGADEGRWEPEREDIATASERLLKLTDAILADRDFEARPGRQCGWCPWQLRCPDAHRVEVGDLNPDPDLVF